MNFNATETVRSEVADSHGKRPLIAASPLLIRAEGWDSNPR